jgi:hypothetical protein
MFDYFFRILEARALGGSQIRPSHLRPVVCDTEDGDNAAH